MLLKIEVRESTLIYLYNLLVPQVQATLDNNPAELANLLAVTNEALNGTLGDAQWFACTKEGCDQRPFVMTRGQVEDAEGVISCEYCGDLCQRVAGDPRQPFLL